MKLLIVSATSGEIGPFAQLKGLRENSFGNNEKICWLSTGVGMVNTTFHLTRTLMEHSFDLVINAGIAGSFDRNISIGEVVNVVSDQFAELGAQDHESFLDLSELKLADPDEFPFEKMKITGNPEVPGMSGLRNVNAITVNTVHGNSRQIEATVKRLSPQIESMEGAAVMYTCRQLKIPYYQLRSISNYVEPRNRESWNIPLAVRNLNEALGSITNQLK